jgi:hypothetical protein
MESLNAVNRVLRKPFCTTQHAVELKKLLNEFLIENEEGSSNFQNDSVEVDDLRPLLSCLEEADIPSEIDVLGTKMLKVLLRKDVNRRSLNDLGVRTILVICRRQMKVKGQSLLDICSVITNSCFDASNAYMFIEEGGMEMLLPILAARDVLLLTALLSAFQALCYIPTGRRVLMLNKQVRWCSATNTA